MAGRSKLPKKLPISKLFPNFVTLMGLCAGLSSIRFALDDRWHVAVLAILVAGVLDGMDGRIARLLNASSEFGAQLDSLADFMSFGLAPALLLYLWVMEGHRGAWAVVLLYAVCCAVRLARFNTDITEDDEAEAKARKERFFVGVPAPMGAVMVLFLPILSFEYDYAILRDPYVNAAWLVLGALLMASRLPTFSLKKIVIRSEWAAPLMVLFGMLVALMIIEPWRVVAGLTLIYIATLFISPVVAWRRR